MRTGTQACGPWVRRILVSGAALLALAGPVAGAADPASAHRACQGLYRKGDLAALRQRCADLRPADHPVSLYWTALLTTDMNVLRKRLTAESLRSLKPAPFADLLLLAGRYQHSRAQADKLAAILAMSESLHRDSAQTDSLRALLRSLR